MACGCIECCELQGGASKEASFFRQVSRTLNQIWIRGILRPRRRFKNLRHLPLAVPQQFSFKRFPMHHPVGGHAVIWVRRCHKGDAGCSRLLRRDDLYQVAST